MNNCSDRLIVALDYSDINSAKNLVDQLGDTVSFYKIGLELLMSGNYFQMIEYLAQKNKKVFADLKLYDISATIAKAVKNLSQYPNINFLTIHSANQDIMEKAAENKGKMRILAVTVLTNLDHNDLVAMGFDKNLSVTDLVIKKSQLAKKSGVDGVISSGLEAKIIRENLGKDFLIVTPGIRLESDTQNTIKNDDQKRVVDVKTAFGDGVNHIVVGRPITAAENPVQAAQKFQQEIIRINN